MSQDQNRILSLREVFADFPYEYEPAQLSGVPVRGIAIDSRSLRPGELFVALSGASRDGHEFIAAAVRAGAAAVVGERDMPELAVPYVRVPSTRAALTWLAAAYYDWPGRKLTVIGVTGTDGKTTTSTLLHSILQMSTNGLTGLSVQRQVANHHCSR